MLEQKGGHFDADTLYDVVLIATGSEKKAEAAFIERRKQELKRASN